MGDEARQAHIDFEHARVKGFLTEIATLLSRRSNELLSFDDVKTKLHAHEQFYRGVQTVPIAKIVGSLNRYQDFDHQFLPTQSHTRARWIQIDAARLREEELPPVELYKMGDAYFVRDGNHRVSVARERGQEFIDAEIVEYPIRVPLDETVEPRELLLKAEYADFLERTGLDRVRPEQRIEFSILGGYKHLLEHISVHRYYLGLEHKSEVAWAEAVVSWYDHVYMPLVQIVRQRRVLDQFPARREADLYLWIIEHCYYLSEGYSCDIGTEAATQDFVDHFGGSGLQRWVKGELRSIKDWLHRREDSRHDAGGERKA